MPYISDDKVEVALDYLRENAAEAAQARANRIYLEDYSRVVKAQIMTERQLQPIGAQERDAYADKRYAEHLKAVREAVMIDEEHRFKREAAQALLDSWRTQSATERAMKI